VALTGGVAANSLLRKRIAEEGNALGIPTFVPPLSLCTDNGAMIAGVGYLRWCRGEVSDLRLSVAASAPLPEAER